MIDNDRISSSVMKRPDKDRHELDGSPNFFKVVLLNLYNLYLLFNEFPIQ